MGFKVTLIKKTFTNDYKFIDCPNCGKKTFENVNRIKDLKDCKRCKPAKED